MTEFRTTPETESSARMLAGSDFAGLPKDGADTPDDVDWLKIAKNAYETSTDFVTGLRKQWERAIDHFNGKHASGSKYHSDSYRARSRLFRPKTRELMRRGEAATAAAFFSTRDIISIEAVDEFNEQQRLAAKVVQELVQHRLTKSIPWFQTLVGASQDARNYGVCISKQWWEYAESDDGTIDHPRIDLVAPENFRIDPASSWVDPIGTTPYLIEVLPMFVGDVRERMEGDDPKTGQPAWKDIGEATIRLASQPEDVSIRQARNKRQRQDAREARAQPVGDFEMVNVHCNIIRRKGVDWLFYSLGTLATLSEAIPLRDAYPWLRARERPYVMGVGMIETHKVYPFGHTDLVSDLQVEINDLTNLRMDQRRLAIMGRYFVKIGKQVDVQALTRGVPGSVIHFDDPRQDVVWDRAPDAPASADTEEDRLAVAFDGVSGNFSQSSVQSNRKLNETVGGMAMVSNSANLVLEYDMRVFAETWAEKTLAQLTRMVQTLETDETVMAIAGRRAGVYAQYAQSIPPELIEGDMTVSVNVGIGATDPNMKVQKFAQAMAMLSQLIQLTVPIFGPGVMQSPGFEEVANEMFGLLGYKDAKRFLDFAGGQQGIDPRAQQMIQQLQQRIAELEQEQKAGIQKEQTRARGQAAIEQVKGSVQIQVEQAKHEMARANKMLDRAAGIDDREFGARREDQSAQREDARAMRDQMLGQQQQVA